FASSSVSRRWRSRGFPNCRKSGRLGGLAGGVLLACVEKYTTYLSWSIQNVLLSSKEKPA
ncbi:hypothetical protein ACSETJ_32375, partial [Pseudomonas aeruginosa]